jgi:hypothetical protein
MQRVFAGLLVGAVQPEVVKAATAAIDFIYYSQFHSHTAETLMGLESALNAFHEHKDIFLALDVRKHFNIPKLHSMMHYVASIKLHGSADGYNSEAPERLHIDYAKNAFRASNRKNYTPQMTKWLQRREDVHKFSIYLDWRLTEDGPGFDLDTGDGDDGGSDVDEVGDDSDNEDDASSHAWDMYYTTPVRPVGKSLGSHTISSEPGFPGLSVDAIITEFRAPSFLPALLSYLRRTNPPPQTFMQPSLTDCFDAYRRVSVILPRISAAGQLAQLDRIRATPSARGQQRRQPTPSHFDTVLVRTQDEPNEYTKGTALEGMDSSRIPLGFLR